jgi:aryl-alcohol dehydrogenase-like predicted oxidoreductase
MRQAYARLGKYGIPLASNQVHYNLLHRTPEHNNVLQTCRELKVTLIAYSPLAQGLLTGKYTGEKAEQVQGMRRMTGLYRKRQQPQVQRVLKTVQTIAAERGKTPAQIALNWLMSKDELIIPIPGAKNKKQAEQNAGALGWQLTEQEMARLDSKV